MIVVLIILFFSSLYTQIIDHTISKEIFRNDSFEIEVYSDYNYLLIGADQNGKHEMEKIDYNKKLVLVLGSESKGLDKKIKSKLNKLISIKKFGYGESLNVAIAGSILMKDIALK